MLVIQSKELLKTKTAAGAEKGFVVSGKVEEEKYYNPPPEGAYRVGVFGDEDKGPHYAKQNPDGTWSQKAEKFPVGLLYKTFGCITVPVHDPRLDDNLDYDIFVGVNNVKESE